MSSCIGELQISRISGQVYPNTIIEDQLLWKYLLRDNLMVCKEKLVVVVYEGKKDSWSDHFRNSYELLYYMIEQIKDSEGKILSCGKILKDQTKIAIGSTNHVVLEAFPDLVVEALLNQREFLTFGLSYSRLIKLPLPSFSSSSIYLSHRLSHVSIPPSFTEELTEHFKAQLSDYLISWKEFLVSDPLVAEVYRLMKARVLMFRDNSSLVIPSDPFGVVIQKSFLLTEQGIYLLLNIFPLFYSISSQ